ncbi:MAG: nitrilase [Thermoleophilales bacterium]|jgi:aliphatic nitrilase|nr:nitrilase [Thermoleophilales bacterium]
MGDRLPVVRAAVVQAAPVFLDREATVDKACDLIARAGADGAQVVAFPEGFIPTHPVWYHFHAGTSQAAIDMAAELFRNSVVVGSPATDRLCDAARAARAWVVMGICEKEPGTTGTMWNSTLYISPEGTIEHCRRKLTPTVGERFVHTGGYGDGLRLVDTDFGAMSSLLCAENSNPLAIFSLAAQSSVLHVAQWPNHFSPTQPLMPEVILTASRALAYRCGCFVLNAASTLGDEERRQIAKTAEDLAWISDPANLGGSCIVGASGKILAGPLADEEDILVADLDLDEIIAKKTIHDYAGHYNRADVFTLSIAEPPPAIVEAPWITAQATPEAAPSFEIEPSADDPSQA